jgi:hypothetical protein
MALDLNKRVEKFTLSLTKAKVAKIVARVGTAYDISGSMTNLYANGTMQEFTSRLVPLGLKFDDNGEIDNWEFNTQARSTGVIKESNYENFVKKNLSSPNNGTNYAPALLEIYNTYFGSKPSKGLGGLFGKKEATPTDAPPVYLVFQTDGQDGDKRATDKLLASLEKEPIYIQFVGIGNDDFSFIEEMGDKYGNVGFFSIKNLEKQSDEELYSNLINAEFVQWMQDKYPKHIQMI